LEITIFNGWHLNSYNFWKFFS